MSGYTNMSSGIILELKLGKNCESRFYFGFKSECGDVNIWPGVNTVREAVVPARLTSASLSAQLPMVCCLRK